MQFDYSWGNRYNVAPGDDVVGVIRRREHEPEGTVMRWGLVPHWAKDPKVGYRTINARAESLDERPAFSRAFERHRCLIVADGFYEFTAPADPRQKRKDRWLFSFASGKSMAIAGLVRTTAEVGEAFTMLTTGPGADVAPYHNRQVVVLAQADWRAWLDHMAPAAALLKPLPAGTLNVRAAPRA